MFVQMEKKCYTDSSCKLATDQVQMPGEKKKDSAIYLRHFGIDFVLLVMCVPLSRLVTEKIHCWLLFFLQIPFIQQAKAVSQRGLKLFASPWSAPAWMKTNKNMSGNGTLIGQPGGPYYKAWANYFVRCVGFSLRDLFRVLTFLSHQFSVVLAICLWLHL